MPPTPLCDVQLPVPYSLSLLGCCTAYRYWGIVQPVVVVDVAVVIVDMRWGLSNLYGIRYVVRCCGCGLLNRSLLLQVP